MTIKQLRYFYEVCLSGNVSKAAETLYVSQPSVSLSIQELEKEFGITLFYRRKMRLIPTAEGLQLRDWAGQLLSEFDSVQNKMMHLSGVNTPIRLGTSPQISVFLLAPLYAQYLEKNPAVRIEVVENGGNELKKMVQNDELDMALVLSDPTIADSFHVFPILRTPILFCMDRSHPFAKYDSIRFDMLHDEKIVFMRTSEQPTSAFFMKHFEKYGIIPNIILYSNQMQLIRQFMIQQSAASFLMEEYLLALGDPELIGRPMSPPIHADVSLIWKKGTHLNASCSAFFKFLTEFKAAQISEKIRLA